MTIIVSEPADFIYERAEQRAFIELHDCARGFAATAPLPVADDVITVDRDRLIEELTSAIECDAAEVVVCFDHPQHQRLFAVLHDWSRKVAAARGYE